MFTHLHVHSCYSLLYGTARAAELAASARAKGYDALAITDINNLYGVHEFLAACSREGLRPIIGAEVRAGGARAVALARTAEGFSHLTRVLTERMTEKDFDLAVSLKRHGGGLALLSDSPGLLAALRGAVDDLYAMVTPRSRRALRAAERLSIPAAAAGDVTFLSPGDFAVHRVLRAIAARGTVSGVPGEECAPADALLFSPEEAGRLYADCPEALENAERIAGECAFSSIFRGFVFPGYAAPGGVDPASELRRRTLAGAELRYGELSESVMERIDYELDIIGRKGFAPYFLVVADIVKHASRLCGRGSAAASVVSYSLGITNVDPVRHNLYFERFLNPERADPPDIDIDLAWDERDALLDRVMKGYGEEYSAMVCTHVHFQWRSALRETARAHGIPEGEITRFQERLVRGNGGGVDDTWRGIMETAGRITGLPRHLGVHVGGLVLTPRPISCYVPVERAPKGVPIIAWDKDGAEEAGLVKIDLLGNRSLAVVRDALENLEKNGIPIDQRRWDPVSDAETQGLLARGGTMGVFYVESPAMRQLQRKTGRGDFEHLVIHSSIIRPAANRFIAEYVRRLKGKAYAPLHPRLEYILGETYGIMCYQEDVSKVAVALAGFTPAEADALRKILSKKDREAKLPYYRDKFHAGAGKNGVEEGTAAQVWEMIESFDGYSFCKPHSASYALVSFQSAYLKAHHPAEFMAAVLSNGGGYYTAPAYISESRRLGLTVCPPDINDSDLRYSGKDGRVRVGLMAVRGLRHETIASILRERAGHGPFTGIGDLLRRVELSCPDAQALVSAGALDSLSGGMGRYDQLWALLREMDGKGADSGGGESLFGETGGAAPRRKEQPLQERLAQEYTCLGFLCDRHPLALWEKKIGRYPRARAAELPRLAGKTVSLVGWLVTRKDIFTAGGEPMEFVSFEDETDIFETVLFPAGVPGIRTRAERATALLHPRPGGGRHGGGQPPRASGREDRVRSPHFPVIFIVYFAVFSTSGRLT